MDEKPLETEPRGMLAALDELLRKPEALFAHRGSGSWLGLGALLCAALYGAAAGFFQGGSQILVAALKAPLIILGSLLLCLPSLYVMSSLAGVEVSGRWLRTTLVGLGGMLGLLLVALLPIVWLFSVSSRSLGFMTLLHFFFWLVALGFAGRFLALACRARGSAGAPIAWIFLLLLVSLQLTSQLRPVLFRPAEMELFAPERRFFLEHFGALWGSEGRMAQSEAGEGASR